MKGLSKKRNEFHYHPPKMLKGNISFEHFQKQVKELICLVSMPKTVQNLPFHLKPATNRGPTKMG
jgi:hypothetical protein